MSYASRAVPFLVMATCLAFHPAASLARTKAKTATAVQIHVSPVGNDTGDGSAKAPFKTLPRAQAAVRAVNASRDVTVILADGVYSLTAPLVFTAADGGQGTHTVVWQAAPKAKPMLSGGMNVTGFTLMDAKTFVYAADVPKGLESRQLWIDGVLAERPKIEIKARDIDFTATGFVIKNPDLAYIADIKHPSRLEMEMTGFFTDRYAPVKSIDGKTVTMQQPSWDNNTWGYDTLSSPIFPDDSRLFLVNAPELFGVTNQWHSNPYQWFIDPETGKLYVRIAEDADINALTVTLPRLETLVSISGTLDAPVRNLTFKGLRFSYSSWTGPSAPTGYASQQSGAFLKEVAAKRPADAYKTCGWGCPEFEAMRQRWHQMPAAVQVAAARHIRFENNQFSQLGQIGLGIGNDDTANLSGAGLAAQDITVTGNRFTGLSGGAVMAGGVRADAHHPADPRLINARIIIDNNVISNVSQDYKENAAILTTYIDGAHITHNDISEAPYDAIDIGWGWGYNDAGGNPNYRDNQKGYETNIAYDTPTTLRNTLVAGNRVHGVKSWYKDGGAIYNLSANPGAVIRDNHVFGIGEAIGIYLDEGSKFITVTNNVIETRGRWLNANTVGRQYTRGITTKNTATGNFHDSNRIGGRWIANSGNLITDDHLVPDKAWPEAAKTVIDQAGVRK
ncbi:right-handed parallel beta-helix repeat-containing protein [Asticcacaulis sp. 201]|uniref:right-handed parallel beta-helix repeat-containing protein n=1 Tax=Asticcacaulis sp. 201 TaxID=3028787 RepID=UPI0029170068|nr:right-handed parallel beta-helix repeat-containing protein [Asticcacaulis sp. 201]MDV6330380.1 right-handed parallel beta-helix repeat-containing protein [Asticcacaulis sp. 201]